MWKAIVMLITKWGCHHQWECEHTMQVFAHSDDPMPRKTVGTYICKKCGKFNQIAYGGNKTNE